MQFRANDLNLCNELIEGILGKYLDRGNDLVRKSYTVKCLVKNRKTGRSGSA